MDVRNCKECGKLYNYISGMPPLCNNCLKALEEKFTVVKEFIYNNPNASMQLVAEETQVSVIQLKKWIREERLAFSEDSVGGIECENCGAIIKTGKFCKPCKDKLANNLGSIYKKEEPTVEIKKIRTENGKMRFLNSEDYRL